MSINSRFHDLGFGNKEIDLNVTPFDNNSLEYANIGFGNKLVVIEEEFINTLEFNFGSKVDIFKNQTQHILKYNDLMETGSLKISAENFKLLKLKNKSMKNVFLNLTSKSHNNNFNLYFETLSNGDFKVFNDSNRDVIVFYVATSSQKIYEKIVNSSNNVNLINNIINKELTQ